MVWYPFIPVKADILIGNEDAARRSLAPCCIFISDEYNHNPQSLTYFLGYDKILISYKWKDIVMSIEAQNIESGLKRGHFMGSISYSATSRVKLYMQYFSEYGQSLIEYDHHTTSYGIGIALSDWQ